MSRPALTASFIPTAAALRPRRLRPPGWPGSMLALAAAWRAVSSQLRSDVPVWMLVLPLMAGIALAAIPSRAISRQ